MAPSLSRSAPVCYLLKSSQVTSSLLAALALALALISVLIAIMFYAHYMPSWLRHAPQAFALGLPILITGQSLRLAAALTFWLSHTAIMRQPRGDTRVTPEDKQRLAEQRAAEIAKRRANFNATSNWGDKAVHWQPWH
jgi:hypothetical protein